MVTIRRRGVVAAAAAAAAAAVVVVAVELATSPGSRTPALPSSGITAAAVVEPRPALFGDTVLAHVSVLLDRRRIDPASVSVAGNVAPYSVAGIARLRRDAGRATRLTYTLRLRCLLQACLPPDPTDRGRKAFNLSGVRLTYHVRDGAVRSMFVNLPAVEVASRMTPTDVAVVGVLQQAPFHAAAAPGPVDYSISPTLLVVLLLAAAALLLAAAIWLALRYGPRPRPVPVEPPPAPPVELTPLERALLVLERARARGPVPDQRKALELLSGELGRSGEPELALSAQGLAWSAPPPSGMATLALTEEVRAAIERSVNGRPG